ncbi:hypothetical protein HME9304_03339 [Flagellimonas maritima]|uniref:SMP-30/Gluconolactonase/LRE-like region domain-containing protein n=1 Tax=Flagellimonas maritima TaxID=1383885 RepID=A0A2Z4LX64_9FLAO|nr:hypothetical protein [Allomuricauda aurantiaca]AWX46306.1 hypothetical protein HME9304_03339 [Allomuricauda aurantiaca]
MKTGKLLLKSGLALACLALFTLTSCIDDFDGGGPKPKKVITLFGSDFPANDGLHVNGKGTVFASNFGKFDSVKQKYSGTKVFKIKRNGSISVKASGFEAPMGGVQDSKGNFYFNNENNDDGISGVLVKIAPDGTSSQVGEIAGWPSGLAIDDYDTIYVANFNASTIHKVSPDGVISLLATDNRLFGCVGIDVDKEGNIITSNFYNANILKVTPQGEVSLIANIPDTTFGFAIGYMTILDDYIYATGINENVIYKVSFDGTSEIFAGTGENSTTDGLLNEATFSQPNGIAADEKRKILYISQFDEPGLRMIKL